MKRPLVIDNGTDTMKSGYAGEDQPRSIFPTVFGTVTYQSIMTDTDHHVREYYIGEEAMVLRGVLRLNYPIDYGIVSDWSVMEKIWHHIFHTALQVNPKEHPILLTEPPLNPTRNREKMAEILFETFNVPALTAFSTAYLSLKAFEKKTGVVIDIGDGALYIVPIYEDRVIVDAIYRMDIGGRNITDYLRRLVRQRGFTFQGSYERTMFRNIKEALCYVVQDPERELRRLEQTDSPERYVNYILPDGETLSIGPERFLAPEVFFQPTVIGRSEISLPEAIYGCIQKCHVAFRKDLYQNLLLSGGSSLFPGLEVRLLKELTAMLPETYKVRVLTPPERQFASWRGGSKFASHQIFSKLWIWKQDYQEYGTPVTREGFCSRLFVRSVGQNMKPHSLHLRSGDICPFCGASGVLMGQQTHSGIHSVFCPTCENKIQ